METIFFKGEYFKEEEEYRLFYRNLVKCEDGKYKYGGETDLMMNRIVKHWKLSRILQRISGGKIITYYELGFEEIMNDLIAEIVIGPKCKMLTSDVEYLLSIWGYNCVEKDIYDHRDIYIHHSELSYR